MRQHANGLDQSIDDLSQESKDLGKKAYKAAESQIESFKESAKPAMVKAKEYTKKINKTGKRASKYTSENPYKVAFGVLTIGVLLTWIFFGRKKD